MNNRLADCVAGGLHSGAAVQQLGAALLRGGRLEVLGHPRRRTPPPPGRARRSTISVPLHLSEDWNLIRVLDGAVYC